MSTPGLINLDVRFNRPNKTYHEKETVSGIVTIVCKTEHKHDGVTLDMLGGVQMQLGGKALGVIDAFSGSSRPIELTRWSGELSKPGKFNSGKTEIGFEFPLEPKTNRTLFETYHGVYIAVQYVVKVDLKKGSVIGKTISKQVEFLVEYTKDQENETAMDKPVAFTITPESVQNKERSTLPKFNVTGKLDSCSCMLGRPLTGEVTIHRSEEPIKSVDIQLARVETCGAETGFTRDSTEIQTLQIADGDVPKSVPVPIYMIFPRLFTCPTLETPNFKIEFEMNLVVLFGNGHLVSENFPITLHRH